MKGINTFMLNYLRLKMEIWHLWNYRVMDKDGRSCMYEIETVDTYMYVSGNPEIRDNTITTISYDEFMASNC